MSAPESQASIANAARLPAATPWMAALAPVTASPPAKTPSCEVRPVKGFASSVLHDDSESSPSIVSASGV